ncbi:MAG: threonyl-tRNA synthetase editing domain-containing protein [Planctomycetota bacterium]
MKLLMFHVHEFWYRSHTRNLTTEEERQVEGGMPEGGLLAWVQVEPRDLEDPLAVARKAAKNLKWLARKVAVKCITLHSFAHLCEERAEPEQAAPILHDVAGRLRDVGYEVSHTPWGYFNEFRMHVEGPSLAKVFKDL